MISDIFEKLPLYSIKLYIGNTASMSLALSFRVLFISFMKSVHEEQFLNTAYFFTNII